MNSGFITKQALEERQRNYESAEAAVQNMTSRRDQAQSAIKGAEAKVEQIEAVIQDLTLVSPENGQIQFQLVREGETVAAGEPIVTILDLTDLYMVIFLKAADTGRLGIGDEARVILDAVPDYVIPAEVSFVASDAQFTPKAVETKSEREKLMFRVQLRVDRQVLQRYYGRVETGLPGSGFVRTNPATKWPEQLDVKLPPAVKSSFLAEAPAPAPAASTPAAASVAQSPAAPPPAVVTPRPVDTPAPAVVTQAAAAPAPSPSARPPAPAPAPAPVAESPAEASVAAAPAPLPPAETTPSPSAEQEAATEFAPASITQLIGAWAASEADCTRLFERRGKALAFRQPADQFAQAAIVEAQRIRLPSAVCNVESGSHEGGALVLNAEYQDSISYTSRTVHVKLRSDTEIEAYPSDSGSSTCSGWASREM